MKLDDRQREKIRTSHLSDADLAERYGVSRSAVFRIRRSVNSRGRKIATATKPQPEQVERQDQHAGC